ncbi:DNRLRE domain-containing protein [Kitasatospora sp. SUK 42]|uniref:DNRLRE domain-containing protein n=1 Tax=Kitasatospora sp. SUK 42 TaxID=1588882 RepID=UPI0018CA004F|nr:DNRLRE domain-containing protein [Kitasatospora sp. SUK 42]MBV2151543.1 DNRLRE domain-containing protein [Kitasatospora sp. SUK 42]
MYGHIPIRVVSGSLALAVAVSVLAGSEVAFAAPPQSGRTGDSAAKPFATTAADIPSARVAARLSGQRVEALSERTETSTTWVNKDGSLTTELSAGPIRFRRDGAPSGNTGKDAADWVDVDLALQTGVDGSVAPKAHPNGLKLAGSGGTRARSYAESQSAKGEDRTLVTLGRGDQQVELQWKGGLPKPELDGTRATYKDAISDGAADLVVEATRTGFEQYTILKQRPSTAGYSYTMPLKAKGLKAEAQPDGGVLFTDTASGEQRAVLPAPVMWDSTVDDIAGARSRKAKVDLKVVQHGENIDLVFTPDAAFLADPKTKYPVTVDPSTTGLGNVFDTYVQRGETVDWSADTELDLGNPGTKNADGTSREARSFITWDTAPIADALVMNAQLSLWEFHAGNSDCLPYAWEVWDTGRPTTGSRWTAQPAWNSKQSTSTETKGRAGCGGAGWVNADVTNLVQTWTSAKNSLSSMGLRAPDEVNTKFWKQFNSANASGNVPKLTVTYNYRPRTGTDQQAGSPFYKDAAGMWWVNSTTPTLRDTFVDPNNDKVDGTFQIFDDATNAQVGNVLVSPYVPSGSPASVKVPAGVLTNGRTYRFRTSPYDGTHYNLGWSPWAYFTVDTSAPSAPGAVSSTDYPSGQWVKGAGQSGVFTVTPPAGDQSALEWTLDGANWTKVATGGTTTPVKLTVTPAKAGTNTLQVRAVDRAENKSEAVSYTFQVGAGGVTAPNDGTRTAARVPLVAEADGAKYNAVAYSWRRSDADAWTQIPAADVANGGTALASWPVALTGGKSPSLTWNATSTVTPDGTVQVRADFTGPNGAAVSSEPIKVVVDRKAGGAATQKVGPGELNLLTGDLTVSASDVSVFGMTVSRTSSSRDPKAAASKDGQAPIFGPNWTSGVTSEVSASSYTEIRKTSATSLDVATTEGGTVSFTANAAGNGWVPEPGSEELTLKGSFASGDFTLSDTEGSVTAFSKVDPAAATWTVTSSLLDGLANTTTTVISEKTVVGGKTLARPKYVVAPTSAATAAACAADVTTKGCRVLEFVYATTTTATGYTNSTDFGDFAGQASTVKLWATAPGAAASTATTVSTYRYDLNGSLRQVWDPRVGEAAKTQYAYVGGGASDGALGAVLVPGMNGGYHMAYGNVASNPAAGDGMLTKVWTNTLTPGSATQVNGTANTTVVYGVPTGGANAPEDLSAAAGATWGQSDLPTDATAVFPADQVPASNSGADLKAGDYARATVSYLNASGQQVNQATPGHRITTTERDKWGHTVRTLTAANRELALGTTDEAKAQLADLGIDTLPSGERAKLLSSSSVYSEDGQRETENSAPLHRVTLAADAVSGTTAVAKAGTQVTARTRTVKTYDEGRPSDGTAKVKDQVTTTVTGGALRGWPDVFAETRTDKNVYDWNLGVATKKVQDAGGLNLTTGTGYDAQGRITSQSLPASSGTDAGTTTTSYWTATGTGPCAGRPEWADLVCQTGPAGAVTGGGANPAQLPVKTTQYGLFGQTAQTDETANGVTRTTVISSDNAGRPVTTTVSGGVGPAAPATTVSYDPATGKVVKQTSATGGTITKAYDVLARLISYTDADGAVTTTEYDALDRPTKVTDSSPSTTTYTYDTAVEPRGLVTSVTDSGAGTLTARYNADGKVVSQGLPGGYTSTDRIDPTGSAVTRTHTRNSDGVVLVNDAITETVNGQWATHTGTPGVTAAQTYTYDRAGRLTQVRDTSTDAVCTTRTYGFDNNTNRTSLATATAPRGQECSTNGATTQTNSYDSADRLVNAGYTYDAFGRTTAVPGSTVGYYNSDLVQQQTTGSTRSTWTLDAAQRLRGITNETNSGTAWTVSGGRTNHYGADGDNPSWIAVDGTASRNVTGPAGDLAAVVQGGATVLQLANLHGDVTLQLPLDTAVAPTVLDYDEYGQPRAGQPTVRYGWIGSKTRSSETPGGGLVLMGVRLYQGATGRFLSVDPVYGGNANAYDYVYGDPLNKFDLDGRWCMFGKNPNGSCRGARQARLVGHAAVYVGGGIAIGSMCAATAVVGCVLAGGAIAAVGGVADYAVSHNGCTRGCSSSGLSGSYVKGWFSGAAYGWLSKGFFRGPGRHRGPWRLW